MPPSRREQQLARARAARQAQRRQQRARRQRIIAAVSVGVLALAGLGIGLGVGLSGSSKKKSTVTAGKPTATASPVSSPTPSASSTAITKTACGATKPPLAPATRTFKSEPKLTIDTAAKYTMTLDTSCGAITVALEASKAPHTVNLLTFLANEHFYDGTRCHRSVASAGLTVLQCGDPKGDGTGGPGFSIAEENTKGAKYTRGTFAMANTGQPNSTGSQFFLVDKDSQLPASYTVAGQITAGLPVLDKILALGNNGANGTGDGAPNQNVYLNKVTVTKS